MDITLVYFIYGLAFFSMGLAMLLETGRSPLLAEASVLLPLAIFGLMHGCHEWLEMFLDRSEWLTLADPDLFGWLRVVILTISFASLLIFGLRMLRPEAPIPDLQRYHFIAALVGYTTLVFLVGAFVWLGHADRLTHLDVSLRYFLAVPAAVLAGLAMQRQATQAKNDGNSILRLSFTGAALGFLIYAVTQMVVPPLDIFPGDKLNTLSFRDFFGFPIQVVRASMAVLITVCLLQSIRAAEVERQKQFIAAQQARLDALERVRLELVKRETMRQELLHRIVLAQEDERARIARELHDETAQMLTAFTFHLAALRKAAPRSPKVAQQLQYLQSLSRQMSDGIYRLVRDLRPAQLDDLGLVAALQYLVDEVHQRLDLEVDFRVTGERRRLGSFVETVFFRVAQEALTNVARHAEVFVAKMDLEFRPDRATLQIIDQGSGFDTLSLPDSQAGWGLAGMRERAESIGAEFSLVSAPGSGTRIIISAPLHTENIKESEKARLNAELEEVPWKLSV
jgi:signal transduction histidine kinase